MYAPTNTLINSIMRWPILAAIGAVGTAIGTSGLVHDAAVAVAGAVIGVIGAAKLFNKQICNCEEQGYTKIGTPKIEWIIEYDGATGRDRPWEIYSMFAGLEYTKQHYASYSTEEHAKAKLELLQKLGEKIDKKDD